MTTKPTEEMLAAFVDGELGPEEAAKVVIHLADTPVDQAYVDDLVAANELLGRAFAAPLAEPMPEAIRAAIFGEVASNVVSFRPRLFSAVAALALAASLAAVAVVVGFGQGGERQILALGPVDRADDLHTAFETLASGEVKSLASGAELMVLATMQLTDGKYCREFEQIHAEAGKTNYGIACRNGADDWKVEVMVSERLAADAETGFVPADGPEAQALTLFLNRKGAGEALSPEAEAAAIAGGWKP